MSRKTKAYSKRICEVIKLIMLFAVMSLIAMSSIYVGFLLYGHLASGNLLIEAGFKISDLINVVLVAISIGLAYWGFKIAKDAAKIAEDASALSVSEAKEARTHNKNAVRPALNWEVVKTSECGFKITITNAGLGPAIIGCCQTWFGEENLSDSVGELYSNGFEVLSEKIKNLYGVNENDLEIEFPGIGEGSVIGVGQSFEYVFCLNHREQNNVLAYNALREGFLLWIEYEDFYETLFNESVRLV